MIYFSKINVSNRSKLTEISLIANIKIIKSCENFIEIKFDDEVINIRSALAFIGDTLNLKIFNAKIALEALVDEVQQYHGCKGYGTSKSVLIPLEFEEGDVCDHFGIYRNDNSKIQGLQVSSYEYDWIDPEQE